MTYFEVLTMMKPIILNLDCLLNENLSLDERIWLLNQELKQIIVFLSSGSESIFNNLRDRLNYLFKSQQISKDVYQRSYAYLYKVDFEYNLLFEEEKSSLLRKGMGILGILMNSTETLELPLLLKSYISEQKNELKEDEIIYQTDTRAKILSLSEDILELTIENEDVKIIKVRTSNIDQITLDQIKKLVKICPSSIPIYLHELKLKDGEWQFGLAVLFPDYLIDVTAISECYSPNTNSVIRQFINLFQARVASKSILIGTAVNEFLDELILNPEQHYKELLLKVFHKYSLDLTALDIEDANEFFKVTEIHFANLKNVINSKFDNIVEKLDDCLLEPSFYSMKYGIQGRLDVLVTQKNGQYQIIELKSGKPFNVNSEGINHSHHAQACLYNMLLESVYGDLEQFKAWILYSGLSNDNLRVVVDQKSLRKRLMEIRNSIILIHLHLSFTHPNDKTMFDFIRPEVFEEVNHFTKRDGLDWLYVYSGLNEMEKSYIKHYTYFISREMMISKCGLQGNTNVHGLASMWLLGQTEKENQFSLLTNLKIHEIVKNIHESPILTLFKSNSEKAISQFRIGDTLILYPQSADGFGMLHNLVFKCTLIQIEEQYYFVRLRGRQFSSNNQLWCLESDSMDRPFLYQFSSLLEFAKGSNRYRKLILGIEMPSNRSIGQGNKLSLEAVVEKAFNCEDYFLLWGPPGSGKTSFFIRELIEKILLKTEENILLMAYTNRAVDELCEVLENIIEKTDYIRVGSRYGAKAIFQNKLYDFRVSTLNSRKDIKELISNTRIFVGTVSSIHGKKELFELKSFDTIIIDEASQILESNIIGLLSRFKRFIMVGDHLQLPSVSTQNEDSTKIENSALKDLGFSTLNESLFERLLRQCKNNNWFHSFDMLHKQGRMHEDIMDFPSKYFYDQKLELIDSNIHSRQKAKLSERFTKGSNSFLNNVLKCHRTIFISENSTETGTSSKSNLAEAKIVVEIVKELSHLYMENNLQWDHNTCGIITPYRVQISTISALLKENNCDHLPITIDTVERYQGSARDIIIISTCVKSISQLEQISSLNKDLVDRKLNVALTRAKEQVILIGNKSILSHSPIYSKLIQEYEEAFLDFQNS
ncbi:MAG: AAA domain-containing protein [Saprospiraceae bacterium]